MVTADRYATKRLGRETAPETTETPSLDAIIEARMAGYVGAIVGPLNERIERLKDELVEDLLSDPVAFVKLVNRLLSVQDCAGIVRLHPDTVAGYTRLPAEHPDHLPRVNDNPILVLPHDLAAWIVRNR